jgi:hypothetical protein
MLFADPLFCLMPLKNVIIYFEGGAYFISTENSTGEREFVVNNKSRRKGFRSMDAIFSKVLSPCGVFKFNVESPINNVSKRK